jgi:hypothetical protein
MKLKNLLMTTVVLACMLMFVSTAFASPSASILYNETNLGSGSYQYDYIFNNTSTAGESLYKVRFYFDILSTTTGSPLPDGWFGTVWTGTNTNTFVNTMSINQNDYIAAGNSLGGFSFIIDHQLGDSDFAAEFNNAQGNKFAFSGTTTVVPEPVSTILFLAGGATLAVRRYVRRRI